MRISKLLLVLMVFVLATTTGCYWNEDVNPNQVGVQLESNKIVNVVGPGLYSGGWYGELVVINVDTQTISVEDPEVLTSDNQKVGLKVTIQARRNRDTKSIENLMTNWSSLTSDEAMGNVIRATASEAMKNGTRTFTLDTLLDDRNGLASAISTQLSEDTAKYSVEIVNVTIENVAPEADYMAALAEKALLRVNTEVEKQRQSLINQKAANDVMQAQQTQNVLKEELKLQEAQTLVDVEVATREGKKIAAANEVYSLNPQAFELKRLELYKNILGDKTVIFLPVGSDPTLLFNNPGNIVPVQ